MQMVRLTHGFPLLFPILSYYNPTAAQLAFSTMRDKIISLGFKRKVWPDGEDGRDGSALRAVFT